MKERLKSENPARIIAENIFENINDEDKKEIVVSGNLLNQYTGPVLKNAKYELNSALDYHKDDFLDLLMFMMSIDSGQSEDFKAQFFLKIAHPFEVICMSEHQMKCLRVLKNMNLNIDATGGIIRKSNTSNLVGI